jgi:hypothetical protein
MPSAHRFQSRLFQTLQAKFYEFHDSVQLRWRQLKVATVWSAQLSLYPLRVAFQASRWSGRVLKQQVAKGARSLSTVLRLEAAVEVDRPIRNILAALNVQTLQAPTELNREHQLPALLVAEKEWQLSIRPVTVQKLSFVEKCSKLWQKWRSATQPGSVIASPSATPNTNNSGSDGFDLARSPAIAIQGVASSLYRRHLVLVTANNQVLDILTAEQQRQLYQRIIFEIAVALRMHRHLGTASPSLPLQTRPLACLKVAWIQIRQSVRTGFLSPSAVLLSLSGSETTASPSLMKRLMGAFRMQPHLKSLRGAIVAGISAIALAPFALALPARAATAPVLPQPLPTPFAAKWVADPVRTRKQWLKNADLFGSPKPAQGKIRLVPDKAPAALASEPFQTAIADWAYRFSQTTPSSGSPPIDVDAAFMGYHFHPLERLLIVLDQIMVWLETRILWLWQQGASLIRSLF